MFNISFSQKNQYQSIFSSIQIQFHVTIFTITDLTQLLIISLMNHWEIVYTDALNWKKIFIIECLYILYLKIYIYNVYSRWDNILFGTLLFKRKKIESIVDNLTTD